MLYCIKLRGCTQQMPSLNTACPKYSQPPTTLQSASMLWESLHDTWPHGCSPLLEVSTSTETRTLMRELGSPAGRQWQTRGMLPFLHCYRACHSDSESSSPSPALLQSKPPLQLQINSAQVTVRINKNRVCLSKWVRVEILRVFLLTLWKYLARHGIGIGRA